MDDSRCGKKTGFGMGALQSRRVSASSTHAPTLAPCTLHHRNDPSNIPFPFPNISVCVSARCLAGMGRGWYMRCSYGGFVGVEFLWGDGVRFGRRLSGGGGK